ncbi:MAG: stage III sporulation protein AB [Lachnospiraceae bacterium]|nr:stage III sporulation protein AB [Lachnospiraceae bacterium]MBP3611125.1 stage III sporulation protein AB [Lachnospiraceae bacterium]
MVKTIGIMLVLVSAYAIGSLFAQQVKDREKWLKDIKTALFLLMGELEYHKQPLPEALELVGGRHGGRLERFFRETAEELKKKEGISMKDIWQQKAGLVLKESPLSREQKEEFAELGLYFMEADKAVRKNALEFYLNRLEEDIISLRETGADKAYLYRTMGMLGGMFLLILVL